MELRVLTWNLKHGRAVPSAGRDLFEEFSAALAGWRWDVALLQEVPPWWPSLLAKRTGTQQRMVLTSRNGLLAARRWAAVRWPDVIKSNGGGSNAILVRGDSVRDHRVRRLRWWPERRWLHAVAVDVAGAGRVWIGNLHAQGTVAEARLAAETMRGWAAAGPAILGGDFNVRDLSLPGLTRAGGAGVDQVFTTFSGGRTDVLDRGVLSDHAPVVVTLGAR